MKNQLRSLPKMDTLLQNERIQQLLLHVPYPKVHAQLTESLHTFRKRILLGESFETLQTDILEHARESLNKKDLSLKPIINGTGIVLHTNLGRALLSENALRALNELAADYTNLEFNLWTGERGDRYACVTELLTQLSGFEDALVVNNNAASVVLVIHTFAKGHEVIASRGELVEIGGSFRVPEMIESSGAHMVEVGCTNKTNLSDYEKAINEKTRLLLKFHPSNYKISGFTHSCSMEEIANLASKHKLFSYYDLGSGAPFSHPLFTHAEEPTISNIPKNVILSISGDKLLGGPQSGIILGSKQVINQLKKNPLLRSFRLDKLSLIALEATLTDYVNKNEKNIPTVSMLLETSLSLQEKALHLQKIISDQNDERYLKTEVVETKAQAGGGSMPEIMLPSFAVALKSARISVNEFSKQLRLQNPPIICRISQQKCLLDVRCIKQKHFHTIAQSIRKILEEEAYL